MISKGIHMDTNYYEIMMETDNIHVGTINCAYSQTDCALALVNLVCHFIDKKYVHF